MNGLIFIDKLFQIASIGSISYEKKNIPLIILKLLYKLIYKVRIFLIREITHGPYYNYNLKIPIRLINNTIYAASKLSFNIIDWYYNTYLSISKPINFFQF